MALFMNVAILICIGLSIETVFSAAIVQESWPNVIDLEDWDLAEPDVFLGIFGDALGYSCQGYEKKGGTGGGKRILRVLCTKVTKPKTKKGKAITETKECLYEGNPHNCGWYNKNNNQPIFYQKMLEKLEKNPGGACAAASVFIKKCKNEVFTKIKSGERFAGERIHIKEVEIDEY